MRRYWLLPLVAVVGILPFQNCSKFDSQTDDFSLSSNGGVNSPVDPSVNPPNPPVTPAPNPIPFALKNMWSSFDLWQPAVGFRVVTAAVWTGARMLVPHASGLKSYNPALNTWTSLNSSNGPPIVWDQSAVWTGTKMIIWGGTLRENRTIVNSGHSYDLATDTWTTISSVGAPSARYRHVGLWTGSKMIIYGGVFTGVQPLTSGAIYDPASNTWTAMSANGAVPAVGHVTARSFAVWTGTRMLVFYGYGAGASASYDPATDTWTNLGTLPVVTGSSDRLQFGWTGSRVLMLHATSQTNGAFTDSYSGWSYNPANNQWTAISTNGLPNMYSIYGWLGQPQWTGSEMLFYASRASNQGNLASPVVGGAYNPATNTWRALPSLTANLVTNQENPKAVWTGSRLIITGIYGLGDTQDKGLIFE